MTAKRKRKPRNQGASIEAPAIIAPDHVRDRAYVAGDKPQIAANRAWRRLSPLEQAYLRGQLAGGAPRHDAQARFEAGKRYGEMFAIAQSTGRDSTDMDRISRSGGAHAISDGQAAAIRAIVRLVCGQGFFPSEAVRQVCADYRHTIPARLREALDALAEAYESSRRERGTVRVG
jgi:hypothetical protein